MEPSSDESNDEKDCAIVESMPSFNEDKTILQRLRLYFQGEEAQVKELDGVLIFELSCTICNLKQTIKPKSHILFHTK